MSGPRFVVYQDRRKQWRWRLLATNNRIVAQGECHTRRRDAVQRGLINAYETQRD